VGIVTPWKKSATKSIPGCRRAADSLQINAMRRKIPNSGMLPDKNETLADVPAQRTPYRIYFTGMSGECQVEL
jgi:hypothetical protein